MLLGCHYIQVFKNDLAISPLSVHVQLSFEVAEQILVTIVLVQRRFLIEFMLSASATSLGILFHMLITLTVKFS